MHTIDSETTQPRATKLARALKLRNSCHCTYCGVFKNSCDRARQPKADKYKSHRR